MTDEFEPLTLSGNYINMSSIYEMNMNQNPNSINLNDEMSFFLDSLMSNSNIDNQKKNVEFFNPDSFINNYLPEDEKDTLKELFLIPPKKKKLLYFTIDNIPKLSGRKRKSPENLSYKLHSKDSKDNIERKIQNHYMNFVIDFTNYLITLLIFDCKNLELVPLSYNTKKTVNKKTIKQNKTSSIKDIILCFPQSKKFTKYPEDHNKKVYEKICEKSDIIKKFLDNKYLSLFEIYYKSANWVNLRQFGVEKEIPIQGLKIELFKDLLEKPKNQKDEQYIMKIKKFAEDNYYL